ncbi:MAG: hypothetical protein IPL63_18685 [Saprospiraceae bacterium]|nr:hypothetical protein [Saprospiraceae bacterium]MBK8081030.1 hypothetical protein [Saprospiraceae bacterium]MBK8372691.1 hypothetical protein [Saprospiraceae bacterium]MBK8549292.1 hypothetical protein [Saprospiraceae bacterium]MBK8820988.1 hypothetical protein [Saprospiraceae bacterium]
MKNDCVLYAVADNTQSFCKVGISILFLKVLNAGKSVVAGVLYPKLKKPKYTLSLTTVN